MGGEGGKYPSVLGAFPERLSVEDPVALGTRQSVWRLLLAAGVLNPNQYLARPLPAEDLAALRRSPWHLSVDQVEAMGEARLQELSRTCRESGVRLTWERRGSSLLADEASPEPVQGLGPPSDASGPPSGFLTRSSASDALPPPPSELRPPPEHEERLGILSR